MPAAGSYATRSVLHQHGEQSPASVKAGASRAAITDIEWRIALRGGRRQAMMMRVAGRRVRRVLQENFDGLLAHIRATAVA